jgi:ABC-type transport system involved in multi-copper enzyme maturation permease subunit
MLKSLVWKEFREVMLLILVLICVESYLIWCATRGVTSATPPTLDVETAWNFLFVIGLLFPILLGLWQGARETQQNTYQFLLHRPIRRELIFASKILVGITVCLVLISLPFGMYSNWAAKIRGRPYMHALGMPVSAGVFLLYLGSVLSMLRQARAFGSQFFALLGAIFLFIILLISPVPLSDAGTPTFLQIITIAVAIFFEAMFAVVILHVGRTRDYS